MTEVSDLIDFIHECGNLKRLQRRGWIRFEITEPESVADHSWRLALMCLVLGGSSQMQPQVRQLDVCKMVKLALIHDLAEARTGDITPGDCIPEPRKLQLESEALEQMLEGVDSSGELHRLWDEYAAGMTPESKFVRALDKLEMAVQALEYTANGTTGLEEFYTPGSGSVTNDLVNKLYAHLIAEAGKYVVRESRD